jgi:drug/metabolite transporter (DMT)-like permease
VKPAWRATIRAFGKGDFAVAPWLNRVGLFASFVASVLIALSIDRLPSEAYQADERGRKIQIAAIRRPRFLRWGLILLALGFAISFVATFLAL